MRSDMNEQTVLLHVPANLPCYGDWDFDVYPGKFYLHKTVVLEVLDASIRNDRPYLISMWLFGAGWYRDYKTHKRLRDLLRKQRKTDEGILDSYQLTLWSLASDSIFSRRFASYVCPECRQEYTPVEGEVIEWTFGEELAAHGGRRFECPKSHTVYSVTEWNS